MPEEAKYVPVHQRSEVFYQRFERKAEDKDQTHYCPGCGHGITHKLIASAIEELGVADRTILVSPVGCSVFAYYYFNVGNVQAAHGRAAAVATGIRRARPGSIVISYQGDGDLAAIGCAEILHAANRGENITVFFLNNAIYGMTGGQLAPTTPLGNKSTTTPFGRNAFNDGYPLRVAELLSTLDAPVYIERVSLGGNKQIIAAGRAIKKAIENQVKGFGFSLVEVLSPCPTIWKMTPVEAQRYVAEELVKTFPPGVYRDRTATAEPNPAPPAPPPVEEFPRILRLNTSGGKRRFLSARTVDYRIRIAGFGGQGVLLLGQILAEAGMDAGLEVSWLPSYGPEMRSGTSNCHVRLSSAPVDSPLVSHPNVLIAMNEPSLRKFLPIVSPGGFVLYNGDTLPADITRPPGVRIQVLPFTRIADELGEAKAGNIVALGALLEETKALGDDVIDQALRRLIKSDKWLAVDRLALAKGRESGRLAPVSAY
jgi:2-oxoisovalerate ferredoxin oxidoreductase beta subunit